MPTRIAALMLIAITTAGAETITKRERDFLMSHMHATRKQVLDAVAGLTPAQWNYKAGPDRWSIAECMEHIAISEELFLKTASERALSQPAATPEQRAAAKGKDDFLLKVMPNRDRKAQAPEVVKPTGRWKTPQEMVAAFKTSRDAGIAFVESTDKDLRAHIVPHPFFKEMDAYQWLLATSLHSERHMLQMLEVKENPGFPKQ